MKRALAALALGLAACSSGGDGGSDQLAAVTTTAQPTTTTTAAPREAFTAQLDPLLDSESDEFRQRAYDLATSMCDLLDSTETVAPTTELTDAALGTTSATGLDPAVNAAVMRLGADLLCPEHASVVYDYTADML